MSPKVCVRVFQHFMLTWQLPLHSTKHRRRISLRRRHGAFRGRFPRASFHSHPALTETRTPNVSELCHQAPDNCVASRRASTRSLNLPSARVAPQRRRNPKDIKTDRRVTPWGNNRSQPVPWWEKYSRDFRTSAGFFSLSWRQQQENVFNKILFALTIKDVLFMAQMSVDVGVTG